MPQQENDSVEVTMHLPDETLKYIEDVASLANVSTEMVVNVLLAMHLVKNG